MYSFFLDGIRFISSYASSFARLVSFERSPLFACKHTENICVIVGNRILSRSKRNYCIISSLGILADFEIIANLIRSVLIGLNWYQIGFHAVGG